MIGVQGPKPGRDYSWEIPAMPGDEKRAAAPSPPAPPVTSPAAHHAPLSVPASSPGAPAPAGLTASEVNLIVRTIVEDAMAPLQRALAEAQHRITELERRPAPAPPAPAPVAPTVLLAATPAPAAVAPSPYASAIAAPIRASVARPLPAPAAPLLDVQAIERDVPMDFDNPFDGRRRRRRMAIVLVLALLAIFGGLFALLADSYAPHP
jgi:hypothetical protein